MSDTTVENFPVEILETIFKYLDVKSLQPVALTCKTWQAIVDGSAHWSIYLDFYSWRQDYTKRQTMKEILTASKRRFFKLTIRNVEREYLRKDDISFEEIIGIFEQVHGVNIQEVKLYSCTFKVPVFLQFLKALPNLTKAIFESVDTEYSSETLSWPTEDLPTMSKLKTLEIVRCNFDIRKVFQNVQLETFKVVDRQSSEYLLPILTSQKNLTTLALRDFLILTTTNFLQPFYNTKFPIRLKKLSLTGFQCVRDLEYAIFYPLQYDIDIYYNLLTFIENLSTAIEELELGRWFPDFIYEFIFSNLKSLKTLHLLTSEMPEGTDFYERLEENTSIITLKLTDKVATHGHLRDSIPVKKELFERLPNIENLYMLSCCEEDVMPYIASNLERLKHLTITCNSRIDGLQFLALRSLEIKLPKSVNETPMDWDAFTRANPTITNLFVELRENQSLDIASITRNLKQLQFLTIQGGASCDRNFFETVRANCSTLKSLEIRQKTLLIRIEKFPDIKGFCHRGGNFDSINYPDNSFWNAKDCDGDYFPSDNFNFDKYRDYCYDIYMERDW